ncbi:hypothetical protein [Larsenimonas rhizosphaerae]|uniref:Uncharacterized protein n=1 Tax=Larsenimonas rhizosphaerae TaxID=2944682 RepID=A0AA41ZGT5_9GAMM|nr:hypothetical protein [Larsenimonas rhizosphaerae]MCM2130918.1 hypothetical protein [Larsenimonas rhizosphaerae]MCX2523623.1 hypothetical protein [Larsenimonas rhizosphaerae]
MQVVILADRMGQEMAPMDQRYPPALLPLAGRSILERNLDMLADHPDVQTATVLYGRSPEWFRAVCHQDDRWGIPIRLYPVIGEREPREHMLRLGGRIVYPCLVVRGDVLLEREWIDHPVLHAPVVIARGPQDPALNRLRWSALRENLMLGPSLLASLSHYHELTMSVLSTSQPVAPHGTLILDGLWGSAGTATPDISVLDHGFMGPVSHVEKGAWLHSRCVLETGCYVEEGAELEDVIIMPFTHVNGAQRLKNGIFFEGTLLDSNLGYWKKDRRQAGTLVTRGVSFTPPHRPSHTERAIGGVLAMCYGLTGRFGREKYKALMEVARGEQRLIGPVPSKSPELLGYAARVTRGVFTAPVRRRSPDPIADCIDSIHLSEKPRLRNALSGWFRLLRTR